MGTHPKRKRSSLKSLIEGHARIDPDHIPQLTYKSVKEYEEMIRLLAALEAEVGRWKGLYEAAWAECEKFRMVCATKQMSGWCIIIPGGFLRCHELDAHDAARKAAGVEGT